MTAVYYKMLIVTEGVLNRFHTLLSIKYNGFKKTPSGSYIYIYAAYATREAYAMSKVSKVSTKTYTDYTHNLMNARTKYVMSHIP